jgi:2-polyprenyl-3-methyl-5-hydroxy-6-metoxy-1,4-benzoquinol methylase
MTKPGSPSSLESSDSPSQFFATLRASLADGTFHKLVLARASSVHAGQRIDVRRILLRDVPQLSFVRHYPTNDVTKNHSIEEGVAEVEKLAGSAFLNVHLFTRAEELQLRFGKRGKSHLTRHRLQQPMATAPEAHDREKSRWVDVTSAYLTELGVTTAQHQVVPSMARKWRQIDRFAEVFGTALAASPLAEAKTLRIADFGAGKGYLTFAVHDWLRRRGVNATVTGVELRPDLVAQGNERVERLGLQGLQFAVGDVRTHAAEDFDVVIALHACDIATDHALHLGIRAGAQVILSSPCCHKELRPQMQPPLLLQPILQHGIHLEQEAEMLTDGLRALLLESRGYDTQVFEFVSLEHTQKNKMITAVKRVRSLPDTAAILAKIAELKQFYSIREQRLEKLLLGEATAG